MRPGIEYASCVALCVLRYGQLNIVRFTEAPRASICITAVSCYCTLLRVQFVGPLPGRI